MHIFVNHYKFHIIEKIVDGYRKNQSLLDKLLKQDLSYMPLEKIVVQNQE